MRREGVPEPVVRRLPRYFSLLDRLSEQGVVSTSSESLGQELGISAAQIRRDFSFFGEFGRRGHGYPVEELKKGIAHILGTDLRRSLILIGVGDQGQALLRHFDFEKYGFTVACAFDIDPARIGTEINGIIVYDGARLEEIVSARVPKVAALCVPPDAAQALVDRLTPLGLRCFWNFSGRPLRSDRMDVHFADVDFADSLLALRYSMEQYETDL